MMPRRSAALPALVLALLALSAACSDEAPRTLPNAFGAFNFTLEARSPADQVALLERLGYRSMVLFWPGDAAFRAFQAAAPVRRGDVKLQAALLDFRFEPSWSREELSALLDALGEAGTDLWLILGDPQSAPAARVAAVRELTLLASARGVRVVLYPHDSTALPTAEDAVALMQQVGLPQLKISLHLCHELKAGNRDRLAEVIAAVAPHVVLASIHGASRDTSAPGWSTTIMPLDRGDLDVQSLYLLPLARAGYTGPILLHTFGLEDPPEQHLQRSHAAWEQMARAVYTELGGELGGAP